MTSIGAQLNVVDLANGPDGATADLTGASWSDDAIELAAAAEEPWNGPVELDDVPGVAAMVAELRETGHPEADELAALAMAAAPNPFNAVEMSNALAAIELATPAGEAGIMHDNDDYAAQLQQIAMANYEAGQHAIELAAAPVPRRAEDRLAHMLAVRSAQSDAGLDFAAPASTAGRDLARQRWQSSAGTDGMVRGTGNCAGTDDLGYCTSPQHAMGCGSSTDEELTRTLQDVMRGGAQAQAIDSRGHIWSDGDGRPMTLTDLIEASAGQHRPGREVPVARRVTRFGDLDDDGDQGATASADTRATAARIAAQLGLAPVPAFRGAL